MHSLPPRYDGNKELRNRQLGRLHLRGLSGLVLVPSHEWYDKSPPARLELLRRKLAHADVGGAGGASRSDHPPLLPAAVDSEVRRGWLGIGPQLPLSLLHSFACFTLPCPALLFHDPAPTHPAPCSLLHLSPLPLPPSPFPPPPPPLLHPPL